MIKTYLLLSLIFFAANSNALSPDAIEGKVLYPTCHVCHNPAMDPPLAPPMWGVQRRYKRGAFDDEDFIKTMASFVKAPTLEAAIHDKALEQLGLMPPMPLPDEMLEKIATYILEEKFPPPCEHWQIAAKRAVEKNDLERARKDQRQFERFCR